MGLDWDRTGTGLGLELNRTWAVWDWIGDGDWDGRGTVLKAIINHLSSQPSTLKEKKERREKFLASDEFVG